MTESLKAARERVVREFDAAMPQECGLLRSEKKILGDMLRELQRCAIQDFIARTTPQHELQGDLEECNAMLEADE